MPQSCEICRSEIRGAPRTYVVDGATVILCGSCYARVSYAGPKAPQRSRRTPPRTGSPRSRRSSGIALEEAVEFVEGYGGKVRKAREKLGLSQEELAKKINEKATLIKKIEQETFRPSMAFVRKLERFLKIELVKAAERPPLESMRRYSRAPGESPSLEEVAKRKRS